MLFNQQLEIAYNQIYFEQSQIYLAVKRIDQIDPFISGNKYFKLKYNVQEAVRQGSKSLVTFGGAFSNHIAAVAAVGNRLKLDTIGIIRGDELKSLPRNTTLAQAEAHGMQLHFVSRQEYRQRHDAAYLQQLKQTFTHAYLIPEGGTNLEAVKGCMDILSVEDQQFDTICCAVGTGGTFAGLIEASALHQNLIGFAVLKGDFLKDEVRQWTSKHNWHVQSDYHFGGYAKTNAELQKFMQQFEQDYGILLDPIYTNKMFFGLFDLIQKGYFAKGTRILVIHTGGLQGRANILHKKT